jgi:hypothetical protein
MGARLDKVPPSANRPVIDPALPPADLRLDWDTAVVRAGWVDRLDDHLIGRLLRLTGAVALRDKPRRSLDVATGKRVDARGKERYAGTPCSSRCQEKFTAFIRQERRRRCEPSDR